MPSRIAVTGVAHWHNFQDAAYLTRLSALEGVSLVALHDPEPGHGQWRWPIRPWPRRIRVSIAANCWREPEYEKYKSR